MRKLYVVIPALILLALGATAGSKMKSWSKDHMKVDGVKLEYSRVVEVEGEAAERFEVSSALGDIEVLADGGDRISLRVEIYEYEPDDVEVELRRGRVLLESLGDHPSAVGKVWVELPAGMDLELETGYGDIDVAGMRGSRSIVAETGLGAITLTDLDDIEEIEVATGKGEIRLGPADEIQFAELDTGMGGIKVRESQVAELDANTGMGSIKFLDCVLGHVSGGTGMGSVRFKRTDYERSDMSSGFGRVSRD